MALRSGRRWLRRLVNGGGSTMQRKGYAVEAMEGEKVYYSQSGCWMTVPGTAGLRVLDISLGSRPGATEEQAAALASAGLTAVMLPPLQPGARQALAAAVAAGGAVPAAALSVTRDAGGGLALLDEMYSAGIKEALLEIDMSQGLVDADLEKGVAMVEAAAERGLQARAVLLGAFQADPDDPDENLLQQDLEDAVVTLADAGDGLGCGVITLADCGGAATDDSLREAVEACFGVDVRGEGLMERLSLRLRDAGLCEGALQLGITRFEASAAAASGTMTAMELLMAVEAFGLRHSLDATKLKNAAE